MCNQYGLKLWSLAAIVLKFTGTAMHISGTVTNSWIENQNITVGLFKACTGGDCSSLLTALDNAGKFNFKDKVAASQTLAILAILVAAGTFSLSLMQYLAEHLTKGCYRVRICLPICSLVLSLLSFFFIVACAIVVRFSDENMDLLFNELDLKELQKLTDINIGFSLVLSVTGGVLIALGGLMAAMYERKLKALRKSQFDHARFGTTINSEDNGEKQNVASQYGMELKSISVESKVSVGQTINSDNENDVDEKNERLEKISCEVTETVSDSTDNLD
ncbi:hypothetical protein Btru_066182 [Bulinus truncatus]|nr:hypothetical protein Btru_066182 [Bulinus truncatus]